MLLSAVLMLLLVIAAATAHHRVMKGKATYYADEYAGQTMACGGKYQPWKMVAAHHKLACGTRLKVKNRSNGRVVTVTVRDRKAKSDIILDLSKRAAKKLGFLDEGVDKVRAAVLHD